MRTFINNSLPYLFLLFTSVLFAQENPQNSPIDDQFNKMWEEANSWKEYEVVKKARLLELQENTLAEISDLKKQIAQAETNIEAGQKEISSLKASLQKTQNELATVTKAKEQIAFLGIPMSKSSFRVIMWAIVLILALLLGFFVYKYKNSHFHTREAKKNQHETQEEFDAYRKNALEKQQKMGRMLQDERNKSVNVSQK